MVMLNQLTSETITRIVKIQNVPCLRKKLQLIRIIEGSFIRVISYYGTIIFEIEKRIFSVGYSIAEKIRVIEVIIRHY